MVAWRIVKEKHAATAFSGEGAALAGGRWNSRGTRVVYASTSLSLAALELLVHLNPQVLFKYVAFRIDLDDALVAAHPKLPANWQAHPPPPQAQSIGDKWAREAPSVALSLPSVIVPGETNILINPLHGDFQRIRIGKPEPFAIDPRLLSLET